MDSHSEYGDNSHAPGLGSAIPQDYGKYYFFVEASMEGEAPHRGDFGEQQHVAEPAVASTVEPASPLAAVVNNNLCSQSGEVSEQAVEPKPKKPITQFIADDEWLQSGFKMRRPRCASQGYIVANPDDSIFELTESDCDHGPLPYNRGAFDPTVGDQERKAENLLRAAALAAPKSAGLEPCAIVSPIRCTRSKGKGVGTTAGGSHVECTSDSESEPDHEGAMQFLWDQVYNTFMNADTRFAHKYYRPPCDDLVVFCVEVFCVHPSREVRCINGERFFQTPDAVKAFHDYRRHLVNTFGGKHVFVKKYQGAAPHMFTNQSLAGQ